jgi:hypothetical protein
MVCVVEFPRRFTPTTVKTWQDHEATTLFKASIGTLEREALELTQRDGDTTAVTVLRFFALYADTTVYHMTTAIKSINALNITKITGQDITILCQKFCVNYRIIKDAKLWDWMHLQPLFENFMVVSAELFKAQYLGLGIPLGAAISAVAYVPTEAKDSFMQARGFGFLGVCEAATRSYNELKAAGKWTAANAIKHQGPRGSG